MSLLREPASFAKSYSDFLNSTFKKYGFKKEKEVYSSRDVSELFGAKRSEFLDFLESFVKKSEMTRMSF